MPFDPPSSEMRPLERLLEVMARLRDPDGGCPWDQVQTFATIAPYTVEEAYEVADAIVRGDLRDLKEELGDLLLQVVFHARIAQEQGAFDFDAVAEAITDKMIRRHPHVFAEQNYQNLDEQSAAWDAIKAQERASKGRAPSLFDDVPLALPGMSRAVKLTKRAARVGFDWPTTAEVLAKLREELEELEVEIQSEDTKKIHEEMGDLLFVCANLARKLHVDPEDAVRAANVKFVRRFAYIEQALAERGSSPEQSDLAEMDSLWNEVRALDKAGKT